MHSPTTFSSKNFPAVTVNKIALDISNQGNDLAFDVPRVLIRVPMASLMES